MTRLVKTTTPEDPPAETGVKGPSQAETLFRQHAPWLRQRLSRRLGPDLAEEIVQDTWTRLVARGDALSPDKPKPFLARIAANLMIDRARRRAVRPAFVALESLGAPPAALGDQTQVVLLKQIIRDMPEPLRTVFLLSRFGGWTYQSIADHLNISVKAVEWRMSKALAYCTERLRD